MQEKEFKKLIDKNKHQVFFMSTPLPIPFNLGHHTFVITNNKGVIHRWEVWMTKHLVQKHNWDYLYEDLFRHPWDGHKKYIFSFLFSPNASRSTVILFGKTEGSLAKRMIAFIKNSKKNYTLLRKFHFLPGPNCHTYTQWILNAFPESKIELPPISYGKGYVKK